MPKWTLPLLIVSVVFLCFSPSLGNGFVNWDDPANLTQNHHIRGFSAENLRWMWSTFHMGHYIPLTWMTLAADWTIWGQEPFGYHLTSLLLHAANTLLLFFLILRLFPAPLTLPVRIAAAAGALFFGIHPLRVESVAWATERRDVLSGLFFLLALHTWLRRDEGRRWYGLALAAYAASLLSKALGLFLPVVLLVLDVFHPGRRQAIPWSRRLGEKIPFFALFAAGAATTLAAQAGLEGMLTREQYPWADSILQPGYRLGFYLWKTILPYPLSPLYPFESAGHWGNPWFLIPTFAAAGLTSALFALRRRWPAGLAVWILFCALLLPALGFLHAGPQLTADRYTYLAAVPLSALVAAAARRPPFAIASALCLAVFGVLTFRQTMVWRDSLTLWNHVLDLYPNSEVARLHRGLARVAQGDAGGIDDLDEAIRLAPWYEEAYLGRGRTRANRGDLQGALEDYDRALRLDPTNVEGLILRANALAGRKEFDAALRSLNRALTLDPRNAIAYSNRGLVRVRMKDFDGALEDYARALEIQPADSVIWFNRGVARQAKGDFSGAVRDLTMSLSIEPGRAAAYAVRGLARQALGDVGNAIQDFEQALRRAPPDWPDRGDIQKRLAALRDGVDRRK